MSFVWNPNEPRLTWEEKLATVVLIAIALYVSVHIFVAARAGRFTAAHIAQQAKQVQR